MAKASRFARVSLRTLLLAVATVAAVFGLVRTWPAWVFEHVILGHIPVVADGNVFSRDGRFLLVANDRNICQYDLATGQRVRSLFDRQGANDSFFVMEMKFTPDSKQILTTTWSADEAFQFDKFDVETGKRLFSAANERGSWGLDGSYLVRSRESHLELFVVHTNDVRPIAANPRQGFDYLSPHGDLLLLLGEPGKGKSVTLAGWDLPACTPRFQITCHDPIWCTFPEAGEFFAILNPRFIHVFRSRDGKEVLQQPLVNNPRIQFSADGRLLALGYAKAGSGGKTNIKVFDVQTGEAFEPGAEELLPREEFILDSARLSPNGTLLIERSAPGRATMVDAESFGTLFEFGPHRDEHKSNTLTFSPDGRRVALLGDPVEVWRRRRPEHWWGVAWLPAFWALVVCGGGLLYSVVRDVAFPWRAAKPAES